MNSLIPVTLIFWEFLGYISSVAGSLSNGSQWSLPPNIHALCNLLPFNVGWSYATCKMRFLKIWLLSYPPFLILSLGETWRDPYSRELKSLTNNQLGTGAWQQLCEGTWRQVFPPVTLEVTATPADSLVYWLLESLLPCGLSLVAGSTL